ncbi:MAG TPA: hypothetical protein VMF52_18780 [Steroidobacteraceae bacterium]|nr:hypothetical protein [Steroidobacteraceae bacterium]
MVIRIPGEKEVKKSAPLIRATPPHDYRPALQGALTWLGKRYLLAEPLNKRREEKPPEFNALQRA